MLRQHENRHSVVEDIATERTYRGTKSKVLGFLFEHHSNSIILLYMCLANIDAV